MGCIGTCSRLIVWSVLIFLLLWSFILYAPIPESWAVEDADFSADPAYQAELAQFNRVVGLLKDEYVDVGNNIKIHVWIGGKRDGDPVLFLHGFPETALLSWWQQIEHFINEGRFVILPDQRGYNTSSKPKELDLYNPELIANDAAAVIKYFLGSNGTTNVVSHDWGAMIHWLLMMRHPNVLRKNVLMNVPHPKGYMEGMPMQGLQSWYFFIFQTPQFLLEHRLTSDNYAFMRFLGKFFYYPQYPSKFMIQKYREAWSVPGAMEASINWYRYTLQRRPVIPNITIDVPLRILWGAEDRALSINGARASVKYCTKCSLKEFNGIGHFLQHAIPDTIAKEASEFFFGSQ